MTQSEFREREEVKEQRKKDLKDKVNRLARTVKELIKAIQRNVNGIFYVDDVACNVHVQHHCT